MSNPSREEIFKAGVTSPVSSMSIVVGDAIKSRCNGHCPFCISRATNALGIHETSYDRHLINWATVMPKFRAACRFAKTVGVTNILLTGRGEPTLYQQEITRYLQELACYEFPFIDSSGKTPPLQGVGMKASLSKKIIQKKEFPEKLLYNKVVL